MLEKQEGCAHEAISTRICRGESSPLETSTRRHNLRELKVESFLPNYGFYGPQQPVAASSEPSDSYDFAVRPSTCLSDRRKTRTPSNDNWPSN